MLVIPSVVIGIVCVGVVFFHVRCRRSLLVTICVLHCFIGRVGGTS